MPIIKISTQNPSIPPIIKIGKSVFKTIKK